MTGRWCRTTIGRKLLSHNGKSMNKDIIMKMEIIKTTFEITLTCFRLLRIWVIQKKINNKLFNVVAQVFTVIAAVFHVLCWTAALLHSNRRESLARLFHHSEIALFFSQWMQSHLFWDEVKSVMSLTLLYAFSTQRTLCIHWEKNARSFPNGSGVEQ